MTDAGIKADIKPEIKIDPENPSSNLADIEEFEDDNDLQIPPIDAAQAWLVKVPKSMWLAWNDIYQEGGSDSHVEIGKMRVYHGKPGDDPLKQKIQIRLSADIEQQRDLPKNYDVTLNTSGYNNTVVFSERDLPGHKSQPFNNKHLSAGKPSGIPWKNDRYGRKKPGGYRTAIPKQTSLAPLIQHEAIAQPVQDAVSDAYWEKMYMAALKPKTKTQILEGIDRNMHPGAASNLKSFASLSSRPTKGNKKKVPKEKAVRISQEALHDALNECFNEFNYWSLRALRNRLHQPEAFIKQTLESIADLVRSGDFAMNYRLKPEYETLRKAAVKGELAPVKDEGDTDQGTGDEMGDGDEDDDMGDFEDVKMDGSQGI